MLRTSLTPSLHRPPTEKHQKARFCPTKCEMGTVTVLWDAAWCEGPAPSAGVPPAPPAWAAGLGAQQAADPPCNEFGEFPTGPKYLISHLGPFPSLFSWVLTTTACSEAPPAGQGLPRGFSGVCLGPNPTCTQAAPRSELGLTGLYDMSDVCRVSSSVSVAGTGSSPQ